MISIRRKVIIGIVASLGALVFILEVILVLYTKYGILVGIFGGTAFVASLRFLRRD